jgi:release factor glutamine methyltransferase
LAAWSVGEALAEGRRTLSGRSSAAGSDAQVVLSEVIGARREHLLAHPDEALTPGQQAAFHSALGRLAAGEPLAYVLGWWEFYGRRFDVTPDVLIPRPETELLIDEAINARRSHSDRNRLIDLGTGSGCLAVTLALELPEGRLLAGDVSGAALRVARANAARHRVRDRIDFVRLDLALGLELNRAIVVANLPYVSDEEAGRLPHEPRLALAAGVDGLLHLHRLLTQLGRRAPVDATILLEIGAGQSARLGELIPAACAPQRTWLAKDVAGHDRVLGLEF